MQTTTNPPIWNPRAVASLSFIFTPIFGSYLHAKNWRALGNEKKEAASRIWFYISLVVMAVLAVISAITALHGNSRTVLNLVQWGFFGAWYGGSALSQIKYVKSTYGKTYERKSLVKPILIALALLVSYIAIMVALIMGTGASNTADTTASSTSTGDQGTAPSKGPLAALSGLFDGGSKLDCAAPNVKEYLAGTMVAQFAAFGAPDLIWGLADHRIKVHMDTITETNRNDQSKYVECSGHVVMEFPQEDLNKAATVYDGLPTDPTLTFPLAYKVSTPADPEEAKTGPIVAVTSDTEEATNKVITSYVLAYQDLALATPDITSTSKNTTPWSQDFKVAALKACSKETDAALCSCKFDAFEKVVSERDFARIGYAITINRINGVKFPNFGKYSAALSNQCPATPSLASILGEKDATVPVAPASSVAPMASVAPVAAMAPVVASPTASEAMNASQALVAPPTQLVAASVPASQSGQAWPVQPTQAAIVASFDCSKASSKIEKLTCSTPENGAADRNLAAAYRAAEAKSADPVTLKQGQRAWLKERNVCNDSACLLTMTNDRIHALSGM